MNYDKTNKDCPYCDINIPLESDVDRKIFEWHLDCHQQPEKEERDFCKCGVSIKKGKKYCCMCQPHPEPKEEPGCGDKLCGVSHTCTNATEILEPKSKEECEHFLHGSSKFICPSCEHSCYGGFTRGGEDEKWCARCDESLLRSKSIPHPEPSREWLKLLSLACETCGREPTATDEEFYEALQNLLLSERTEAYEEGFAKGAESTVYRGIEADLEKIRADERTALMKKLLAELPPEIELGKDIPIRHEDYAKSWNDYRQFVINLITKKK